MVDLLGEPARPLEAPWELLLLSARSSLPEMGGRGIAIGMLWATDVAIAGGRMSDEMDPCPSQVLR